MRGAPRPSTLLVWFIAVVLGICSLWVLSEQDIYWQIRAGDDLWRTRSFPHVDEWSFSARGEPWQNIQWLSTLLFRGIYALGAENALIAARGALVTLLFTILGFTVNTCMARDADGNAVPDWMRCIAVASILPLTYLALSVRLQIRSDLLVFIVFAALTLLWMRDTPLPRKRWLTLGAVVLAANLHAGTAPFVLVLAMAYLASTALTPEGAMPWLLGAVAAFFVTPYHVTVLPLLWAHLDYAHHNMLPNPDHVPFTFGQFSTSDGLWVSIGWLLLGGLSLLAFEPNNRKHDVLPTAYKNIPISVLMWVLLAALSVNRMRSIPYHVLYMAPLVATTLPLWRPSASASVAACTFLSAVVAFYVNAMRPLWGFAVNEALFPVGSANFLHRTHPEPNLLHTFAYGAYTVWNLREYPVYVDTRETMYWQLQPEILSAYHSPQITQALAEKYHINAMLMPVPHTRYVPGEGFEDVLAHYLPAQDWALVYFDRVSVVVVRRIPAHAKILAEHTYEVLRPNLPANLYPAMGPRSPERDLQFQHEVQRCLQDEPTNAYCLIALASWWRIRGDKEHAADAVMALQQAQRTVPQGSTQFATLMVELQSAYTIANMPDEAAQIAEALGPGTVMEGP